MEQKLPPPLAAWEKIDRAIAGGEAFLLIIALAGMTLMIVAQVFMRNFFSTGVAWFDPAARHLLLVPVYIGASLATRHRHHIHVDAFTKLFRGANRHRVDIGIALFAAVVCAILFLGGIDFVRSTYVGGDRLEGVFPTWIAQAIMPYGFLMMSVRFVKDAATSAYRLAKGLPPASESVAHGIVLPGY